MSLRLLPFAFLAFPAVASAQVFFPSGPQNPNVTVEATVTHTAVPDILHASIQCSQTEPVKSREELNATFNAITKGFKDIVGSDGIVRKANMNIYPSYGMPFLPTEPSGDGAEEELQDGVSGDVSITLRNISPDVAMEVAREAEARSCTVSWDPRVLYTGKYLRQHIRELRAQISEKKEAYEEVLGKRLTKIGGMYFSTTSDSFIGIFGGSGYDPETNTMDASTSLSILYVIE